MITNKALREAQTKFGDLAIGSLFYDVDLGLCEKKSLSSAFRLAVFVSGDVVGFSKAVRVFAIAGQVAQS